MAHDEITEETPFLPEDDQYHVPTTDDPFWTETNWWSFNVPERGIGAWLHTAYNTNRGVATSRVFVWDPRSPEIGRLAYYKAIIDVPMPPNPDLRNLTIPKGGYSLKCLKPTMDYHIEYSDPAEEFRLEFVHYGAHPPHRFTPGEAPALHNPHFDHLGRIVGSMHLYGETIPIDCWSVRDRTWGPRGGHHSQSQKKEYVEGNYKVTHPGGERWREVERQRGRGRIQYIFGHVDDQTGFLGFVRPQDGDADGWSPMRVGWVLKDGRFERLDMDKCKMKNYRDPETGFSDVMEVDLVDRAGRTMQATGKAISHQAERGAGSNALFKWDIEGKTGWGEDQDGWQLEHFREMLYHLRMQHK